MSPEDNNATIRAQQAAHQLPLPEYQTRRPSSGWQRRQILKSARSQFRRSGRKTDAGRGATGCRSAGWRREADTTDGKVAASAASSCSLGAERCTDTCARAGQQGHLKNWTPEVVLQRLTASWSLKGAVRRRWFQSRRPIWLRSC